jgi:hypothetical protein
MEMALAFKSFSRWADISRNAATLHYATPYFEMVARAYGGDIELSRSPLIGELIRLEVRTPPLVGPQEDAAEQWLRLTIDNYQLAIRRRSAGGPVWIEPVSSADGWHWPYVSARASGIGQIDIWSSDGEVARLGSSERVIDAIRQAMNSGDDGAFERALADIPELLSWRIPRPPYRRSIEWQHHQ